MVSPLSEEQQQKIDMEFLNSRAEFGRFLLRVIQSAGIFSRTANGSDGRNFDQEGRRNLGLEILEMAEAAQPQGPVPGLPAATMLQILLEEARRPTSEKPSGRRYDRNSELSDDDGSDRGG